MRMHRGVREPLLVSYSLVPTELAWGWCDKFPHHTGLPAVHLSDENNNAVVSSKRCIYVKTHYSMYTTPIKVAIHDTAQWPPLTFYRQFVAAVPSIEALIIG